MSNEPSSSHGNEEAYRRRLYGLVIAIVAVAWCVYIFREALATLLALSVPGVSEQRATWLISATLLKPMAQPAQPLPWLARGLIPFRESLFSYYALVALVFVQGALLARRVLVCKAARRIVLPPALNRTLGVLLLIGAVSWCVPIFLELVTRALALVAGSNVQGVTAGAAVLSAFIVPLVWIPAMNLLGPTFFALEVHSLLTEGLLPRGNLGSKHLGSASREPFRNERLS